MDDTINKKWFVLFATWLGLVCLSACGEALPRLITPTSNANLTAEPVSTRPSETLPSMPTSTLQAATPTFEISPTERVKSLAPTLAPTISSTPQAGAPYTVSTGMLDVWDEPAHEKDYWSRQTQVILGERVLALTEDGDWVRIVAVDQPSHKDPRGYPGWVRRSGLVKGWPQANLYAVVIVQSSLGRSEPKANANLVQRMSLDVRLPASIVEKDWVEVSLPDGRLAWLPAADVRLTGGSLSGASLESFYRTAQMLLDAPYLWGGTTSNSMDCSGFIYRLFHAYGYTPPRDADDQANFGIEVDSQSLRRGDLVFTSDKIGGEVTHVVMVWGNGMIIDADSPKGLTIHPLEEFLRASHVTGYRRYLP